MLLRRLKVGPRAALGFSAVALLVIILGLFAQSQMQTIRNGTLEVLDNTLPSFVALGSISDRMLRLRIISFRILVDREESQLRGSISRGDEQIVSLGKAQPGSKLVQLEAGFAEPLQFAHDDPTSVGHELLLRRTSKPLAYLDPRSVRE